MSYKVKVKDLVFQEWDDENGKSAPKRMTLTLPSIATENPMMEQVYVFDAIEEKTGFRPAQFTKVSGFFY